MGSKIRLAGCELLNPDQLLTPNFSGGSTLNGTPGGHRWARVLYGQIGWLSEPLHRFDAVVCFGWGGFFRAFHEFAFSNSFVDPGPATATTSRRRAKIHVPRVSPYSPACIDTGFVEIGLVQLSQSVKTTNVTHTLEIHRRTDGQTN